MQTFAVWNLSPIMQMMLVSDSASDQSANPISSGNMKCNKYDRPQCHRVCV